jgi:hypothetical protein
LEVSRRFLSSLSTTGARYRTPCWRAQRAHRTPTAAAPVRLRL